VFCLALALALLAVARAPAARAEWPAAELSTSLVFNCLPDGSVRVGFKWASSGEGAQWLDLSLINNDFVPGTALSAGPLSPSQSGYSWDGLVPGSWHFARVNTLTPYGWSPSGPLAFLTPDDCRYPGATQSYYPPAPPSHCLNLNPYEPAGCVWTGKADYDWYSVSEAVVYCYSVSQPMHVRIVAFKPDGSVVVVAERFDPGSGGCIGPFQAFFPLGWRTVSLYGGPFGHLLSQTHFAVR
jgi:hypothetical protein